MTRKLIFDVVAFGSLAIPTLLALVVAALPRPGSALARSAVAIAAAWAVGVVYTIYVYNPAGISAGHELGQDSPEMQFDNNTIASHLVGGWIWPAIVVALFFAVRHAWRRTAVRRIGNDA
jgi:hypothetical protein